MRIKPQSLEHPRIVQLITLRITPWAGIQATGSSWIFPPGSEPGKPNVYQELT